MRTPSPLPPPLANRPFTVAEALAAGVSPARLRAGDLLTPFRGVRVPGHLPQSVLVLAQAGQLLVPPQGAISGVVAAHLLDLPLPLAHPDPAHGDVEVVVPDAGLRPRCAGMSGRVVGSLTPEHLLVRRGVRLLHPRHLWCELALTWELPDALALADAVRRRWATQEQMARAAQVWRNRRSRLRLEDVLSLVRYPVDSAMESRVRLVLHQAGLPDPECNRDVLDDAGAWIARPDLSWPGVKVAVEYDGGHHRTDARQWSADIRRRQLLEAAGWRVVVVTAQDLLRRPDLVVALVAGALRERGLAW